MLETTNKGGPRPKCYFAHSVLPAFVDHEQPSQKKRPFSTIRECAYCHTLDLLLPRASQTALLENVQRNHVLQYAKVYMKLSDIIEGDFFNEYIKTGNILMLSEGRPGFDNIFSLHDGVLRLELDKATYERAGLTGIPISSESRKHVKARYAVETNLRLPSTVRGKQGFERIVWAFRNVLDARKAWLFHDLKGANDGTGPIASHQPIVKTVEPRIDALGAVVVPSFPDELDESDQDTPVELLEWLHLTLSGSPRVQEGDGIDRYLSRYALPDIGEGAEPKTEELVKIQWRGFIPASLVQTVAIAAMKTMRKDWFAMSSRSFDGQTHTFLQHEQQTLTWQFGD